MSKVCVCLVFPEWDTEKINDDKNLFDYSDYNMREEIAYNLRTANRYLKLEDCEKFFSPEELSHFLEPFDVFPAYPNVKTSIEELFRFGWFDTELDDSVKTAAIKQNTLEYEFVFLLDSETFKHTDHPLTVELEDGKKVQLPISEIQLDKLWKFMAENRHPARDYHTIQKHELKENGGWPGDRYSEFKRTEAEGKELVKYALHGRGNTWWYYDKTEDEFIRFEYEGDNPKHLYHGFHISREDAKQEKFNPIRKFMLEWGHGQL